MRRGVALGVIAIVAVAISLSLALQKKDHFFHPIFDAHFSTDCIGRLSHARSEQFRAGKSAPADWIRNEKLAKISNQLKHATEAYPTLVSACTSTRRVALHLLVATVFLLIVWQVSKRRIG